MWWRPRASLESYDYSHHSNTKSAPPIKIFIPKDVAAYNRDHGKKTPQPALGLQLKLIYLLRKSWVLQKLIFFFQKSSQSYQKQTTCMLYRLSCLLLRINLMTDANLKMKAWFELLKKYKYTLDLITYIYWLLKLEGQLPCPCLVKLTNHIHFIRENWIFIWYSIKFRKAKFSSHNRIKHTILLY